MTLETIPTPVDLTGGIPSSPRGLLLNSQPAPDGWELGGITFHNVCPEVAVVAGCVTLDAKATSTPEAVSFPVFTAEQSSGCGTFSAGDHEKEARNALLSATEFVLGRELLTGTASGSVALQDATALTPGATVAQSVGALEEAAGAVGKRYVLHASPYAAALLTEAGMLEPETGLSPAGARWIISPGYADTLSTTIYATGTVYVGVGAVDTFEKVGHRINHREAWATRALMVGFDPCVHLSINISTP